MKASAARMAVLLVMESLIWSVYHIAAVAILAAFLAVLELLVLTLNPGQEIRPWGRHRRR